MKIQEIHTRKAQIKAEQSALLANHGTGTEAFFKMAESKTDDCIKFIELESEHLELNQTLLRIGLSLRDIENIELRKGIRLCTN